MSLAAIAWALLPHDGISEGAQLTLIMLADHCGTSTGHGAYPGVPLLASRRGKSERTVQRQLAELREAGLIEPGDQRYVAHIVPANNRPTVWDLRLDRTPRPADPDAPPWSPDLDPAVPEWTPQPVDKRGDTVIHRQERGDRSGAEGVTAAGGRTNYLEPTTQGSATYSTTDRTRDPVDETCEHGDPRPAKCPLCRAARRALAGARPPRSRAAGRPASMAPDFRALAAGDTA